MIAGNIPYLILTAPRTTLNICLTSCLTDGRPERDGKACARRSALLSGIITPSHEDDTTTEQYGDKNVRNGQISARRGADPEILVQHSGRPARTAAADPAPGHKRTDHAGRPRTAIPDVTDRAGSLDRTSHRYSRAGPRHLSSVASEPVVPRTRTREGARYAGTDLLQVRGRQPGWQS